MCVDYRKNRSFHELDKSFQRERTSSQIYDKHMQWKMQCEIGALKQMINDKKTKLQMESFEIEELEQNRKPREPPTGNTQSRKLGVVREQVSFEFEQLKPMHH